jgi:hypothetical protein
MINERAEYWFRRAIDQLKRVREKQTEIDKLRAFKTYVHKRLDEMGVPEDPEPEKNKEHGCRIEGRLNYVKTKLETLNIQRTAFDHPGDDGDL